MTVNPAARHAHCMSRPEQAQDVAPRPTAAITKSPVRARSPIATPCGIEHLDFSPQCQLAFLDNGFRCVRPAAAYVEFHMVGYCKRDDCDEDGNACGFVCADHLDALEYTAECTARELHPTTLARRLARRAARCPSCDRPIRSAADILQVVVML
ncbi:hypothetical protein [Mycobacterium marseillense]|uniref:Uncharacterized protein n=1 Tax=Mycobacterium marseillense TaxID=701042 RepID=A0AAC9YLA9_9MYCO|nr:hypothetical protein [Mycobacterium marseillense]ASW90985.1 hypothetical protein CKJ54_14715 [Mycobacterium marseillense]